MSSPGKPGANREAGAGAPRESIAIIGMACRFPGAPDPDALWERLSAEDNDRSASGPLVAADGMIRPRGILDAVDDFDADFFKTNPRDAALIDPQQRLFLACAFEALETAGKDPRAGAAKIGVFAGCGLNTYLINQVLPSEGIRARAFPETTRELQILLANAAASMPMRVSYAFNLTGPSVNQQAACATGLVAVHAARLSLLAGECDMALAGAAAVRMPPNTPFRPEPGMILSREGTCRAFDRAATGTVYGDGVGVVLLRRLCDARRDGDPIHAVLLGSAVNNDGAARLGFAAPSVEGQAAVLKAALQDANICPFSIGYVETHGTGTPLGDPVEIAALALAYRSPAGSRQHVTRCAIGSVKTRIGHCAEAAGIAGLIAAVLALKHRTLPAMPNFTTPNPQIKLDTLPFTISTERRAWEQTGPRRAGVSAFGMGGTNAHAILEEAPAVAPATTVEAVPHVLPLSARSPAGLRTLAQRFRRTLCLDRGTRLDDICFSAATLRRSYPWRSAIVAASRRELRAKLRAIASGTAVGIEGRQPPKIAFLFAGNVSAVAGSGRELYAREPVFRDAVERCDKIVRDLGAAEIAPRSVLLGAPFTLGKETAQAQVSSFTLGYALSRMWLDWGARPFAVMGHGVGEYAAACVAGVFEPAAVLRLVVEHGQLVQSTTPEMALHELQAAMALARPVLPNIPFISASSGSTVGAEVIDAAHWSSQARRPTLFRRGLATLAAIGADVFVDLGPGGRLAALAWRCMPDRRSDVLPTLSPHGASLDDLGSLSQAVAALFERGTPIDWSSFHRALPGRRCHLPPTPFESKLHWCGPREASAPSRAVAATSLGVEADALPMALVDIAALKRALMSDESRRYSESIAQLERRIPALIIAAFGECGGPVVPGARLPSENLMAGSPPERRRWIARLIAILEEEGLVRRSGGGMCWTARTVRGSDGGRVAWNDDGWHTAAETALVRRVGDRLAALIVGEADPLETLFRDGGNALVASFYCMAPPLRAVHASMAEVVARLAARIGNRPLRLLEIGAGTLTLTRAILDRCPGGRLVYDVTDVGQSVLAHARRVLGHRDGVTVRRLDIERPGTTQGFSPGSYDVIVAANVLHATVDLHRSLCHVAELLGTGGTLVAVEGTAPMRWIDLTFGALPGWWRFQDYEIRALHPLLDAKAWANLVARSCFADPVVIDATELSPNASALPQALIVAGVASEAAAKVPMSPRREDFCVLPDLDSKMQLPRAKQTEVTEIGTGKGLVTDIARAVAEMLGSPPEDVATDRAFDELGLDSLAMLELGAAVERRIARRIPLELIPTDFSIERLAVAISPSSILPLRGDAAMVEITAPNCRLLPLGGVSMGHPLICLPSILDDFAALRPLARRLEDTIGMLGLELTPPLDAARESIPDRAARAVRALRARWAHGPYALIGHSFGGLLAYEVSRQLESGGGKVDLLAIIDIQADAHISFAARVPEAAECLATVAGLIARSNGRPVESANLDALAVRYRQNRSALVKYCPKPSNDLPILLLRSASRHPDDDFLPDVIRSAADPCWGWQNLTSATVIPILLPGDHLTTLAEPHVGVVAGNLALRLPRRTGQC